MPRRIVCLTEEPTEILYLLGEGDRVVGISAWTVRPPEARRDKPVVSAFVDGSVEKIQALEPDLVIGFSDVQADLAAKLVRANLQVLIVNQRSIAEILDVILMLGRLVGKEARARDLVTSYERRIQAVRERHHARDHRPRVYFEEWPDPMLTANRWVSELIEVAGGVDVFAERSSAKRSADRTVESAEVLARRPDVILASWCGKPVDLDSFAARPGWTALPAVQHGRIHELDSSVILQPGPGALTAGLDQLESLLRP